MTCVNAGGAYGFRIHAVGAVSPNLVSAPADWPPIELRVRVTNADHAVEEYLAGESAALRVRPSGSVHIDRAGQRATLMVPKRPPRAALLHPHLAGVATVFSHWCGRESFHAGAFVAGDGVWGVLGEKGLGKSSTLAALDRAGIPVLCDDVLVLHEHTAFAGPRSIDLRPDAAMRFATCEPLGVIGDRERWRMALGPVAPELPLRGWVALRWGSNSTRIRPLRGSDRLRELLCHRALRVPPRNAPALMELSALPVVEFSRPRGWTSLREAPDRLLDAVGRC